MSPHKIHQQIHQQKRAIMNSMLDPKTFEEKFNAYMQLINAFEMICAEENDLIKNYRQNQHHIERKEYFLREKEKITNDLNNIYLYFMQIIDEKKLDSSYAQKIYQIEQNFSKILSENLGYLQVAHDLHQSQLGDLVNDPSFNPSQGYNKSGKEEKISPHHQKKIFIDMV